MIDEKLSTMPKKLELRPISASTNKSMISTQVSQKHQREMTAYEFALKQQKVLTRSSSGTNNAIQRVKLVHQQVQFGSCQIQELIPKLITCEKLLEKVENCDQTRLENAYFLSKSYFLNSEYTKVVRLLE